MDWINITVVTINNISKMSDYQSPISKRVIDKKFAAIQNTVSKELKSFPRHTSSLGGADLHFRSPQLTL